MKAIIFAGGAGTRLWPLSRKNSPKQFGKIFNGRSTLQLAVERIANFFSYDNIYISTNEQYVAAVKGQLPKIPVSNIIAEPEKRDVAPAVGFNLVKLRKEGYKGPIAILWADHLIKYPKQFLWALSEGERIVRKNPKQFAMIGEHPRYAESNLGWIKIGSKVKDKLYQFEAWKYRPQPEECEEMYRSKKWVWNPGYWVVDLDFTLSLYEKYVPKMYQQLLVIEAALGTIKEAKTIRQVYPQLEETHFDNAIMEKIPPEYAVVLTPNMGWSDPGTLYALKEALTEKPADNLERGLVYNLDTLGSLVINEEANKILATVGLDGVIVVNTADAIVVVPKTQVGKIKDLVKKLGQNKKLKKYI
jgi:mannose-1-phosphate guanylyltransferase